MSKIRAYKLAEELEMDRNEFVEKAREHGIELRSPMASLDDEQADLLREKFGKKKSSASMVERRVESRTGSAVIRRRKRAAPPPEPEPEEKPQEEASVEVEQEVSSVAETLEEESIAASTPDEVESVAATVSSEAEIPAIEAVESPKKKDEAEDAASHSRPAGNRGAGESDSMSGEAPAQKKQRKRVREVVNLMEQERIARQVTGRNAPRRPAVVDPRAFVSPRRKRRDAAPKKATKSAAPKASKRVLRIQGSTSVGDLAHMLGVKAPEVQAKLMALGTMASLNQEIDIETIQKVAEQYQFQVQDVAFHEDDVIAAAEAPVDEAKLELRPAGSDRDGTRGPWKNLAVGCAA